MSRLCLTPIKLEFQGTETQIPVSFKSLPPSQFQCVAEFKTQWLYFILIFFFLASPLICGSSRARDQTSITAVTLSHSSGNARVLTPWATRELLSGLFHYCSHSIGHMAWHNSKVGWGMQSFYVPRKRWLIGEWANIHHWVRHTDFSF